MTKAELSPRAVSASKVILTKGIIMTLLGVVHQAAIPLINSGQMGPVISAEAKTEFQLYFAGTGLLILFIGVADILSYLGMRAALRLGWQVALASTLFSLTSGVLGTAVLHFSPPNLLLLGGVIGLVALLASRRDFLTSTERPHLEA
jgi:hypothetical protein